MVDEAVDNELLLRLRYPTYSGYLFLKLVDYELAIYDRKVSPNQIITAHLIDQYNSLRDEWNSLLDCNSNTQAKKHD